MLSIVPVRNIVLFPGIVMPLALGRPKSIAAAQEAARSQRPIGVLLQRVTEADDPAPDQLYEVGCIAGILRYVTAPDGNHHIVCQGQQRFRVREFVPGYPFIAARVERVEEHDEEHAGDRGPPRSPQGARAGGAAAAAAGAARADQCRAVGELPSQGADLVASFMDLKPEEKQEILEQFELRPRLDKVLELLRHRIEVLKISRDIGQQTRDAVEGRQREYILREQLKAIQKELGETEGTGAEIQELDKAIAEAGMLEEVEQQARKELKRLERMPEAAAEHSMVRTYLDWLIELPWSKLSDDNIDIAQARKILDEDTTACPGSSGASSSIWRCASSILRGRARSCASSARPASARLARPEHRTRDRAQVRARKPGRRPRRGRSVAIGARTSARCLATSSKVSARRHPQPGVHARRDGQARRGFHGDPSSALLEVLDPEQNSTFRDNYLGVPFDLSQVMFIGTANVLDAILPLRDRMEVIEPPSYTEDEKVEIAKRYLVKRQLQANGLQPRSRSPRTRCARSCANIPVRPGCAIRAADRWRAAQRCCAHRRRYRQARAHGAGRRAPDPLPAQVRERGRDPHLCSGRGDRSCLTLVGGDVLFVEATRTMGTGKLILTGQLGDIMKERAGSAQPNQVAGQAVRHR